MVTGAQARYARLARRRASTKASTLIEDFTAFAASRWLKSSGAVVASLD